MNRIGNKELAAALTQKHGLSRQEAEKFVAEMYDVLGKALRRDKLVKIKGLGTFKVISVASRKSVDVNSGEPIVIEGRDKITFIPDATLRDEVNRPFAQFETVVVNDGVDFSDIDKKYSDSEHEDDIVEEPLKEETYVAETVSDTVSVDEFARQEPEGKTTETDKVELQQTLDKEIQETKEEEQEEKASKEEKDEAKEEPREEPREKETEEDILPVQSPTDQELLEMVHSQHRTLRYVCIVAASIVVLLAVGGLYLFKQLRVRDNLIEHLEAQMMFNKKAVKKAAVKVVMDKDTDKVTSSPVKKASQVVVKHDTVESQNARKEVVRNNPVYDKDPRIRTGAYIIVGIDHTVTVRDGQTLSGISKSQLGPGMECYIEAVNGWRKEFKAGEKVNVPKLKLKKRK